MSIELRRCHSDSIVLRWFLNSLGWEIDHQAGSHANFQRPGHPTVIVPENRGEIRPSTFSSILRQMGITRAEFDQIADEVL